MSDRGSITALYTVLVSGGDMEEPIADEVRGILDGHIILSRKLANRNPWPAIDVLPQIRAATRLPLIFDSGVEGGLDILRALALGANFVMLGRAWHYALAALGPETGPDHLVHILTADLKANMGQLGARSFRKLPTPRRRTE